MHTCLYAFTKVILTADENQVFSMFVFKRIHSDALFKTMFSDIL